ncbi:UNVERIFIED_CONTAM: hypothetical protein HDU68_010954, partial [Siphonaria sp. JEL0065]
MWVTPEERAHQRTTKRADMLSKVAGRVAAFLRLSVAVGSTVLVVTIEKTSSVKDLIDLVTAEYMFTKISEELGSTTQDNKEKFLQEVEKAQPIVVTQVYNPGMLALNFDDVLESVVEFNDLVTVAYMDQITLGILPNSRENSIYEKSGPNSKVPPVPGGGGGITRQPTTTHAPTNLSYDDSLQSLVSNSLSLSHLLHFALSEYSVEHLLLHLDIESLQTCTDDASVIDYCKYIYLMYFSASTAPIPIIISSDLRKEIADKIGNMDDLDVTVFDSIQEQVLATVQTFLFPRFLRSLQWQKLDEERRSDPKNFNSSQIQSFSTTYPHDLKTLKKVTEILQNPHTASNHHTSLNNNTPVPQESIREFLLTKTAARYIPGLSATSTSGYFDNTVRKRWAVKQRRILKEKKLNKFFGQRVGEDEMRGQRIALGVVLHDGVLELPAGGFEGKGAAAGAGGSDATGFNVSAKDGKAVTEVKIADILKAIDDLEEDVENGTAGDAGTRRKKIEKLRNIFGDQIPTLSPNIARKNSAAKASADSINNHNNDAQEEPNVIVDTVNELTANERRLLNKRNQKLTGMLGEAVDAKLVGVNEVKGTGGGLNVAINQARRSTSGATSGPMLGLVEAPTPEGSVCHPEPKHHIPVRSPLEQEARSNSEILNETESSLSAEEDINELLADEALVSKEARKKRLDKLSKVFGQ